MVVLLGNAVIHCWHVFHNVFEYRAPKTLESLKLIFHLVREEVLEALDICQINQVDKTAADTLQSDKWFLFYIFQY